MEAKQSSLKKFIMQQETQFHIPVYQRNYDWEVKHCEKLFNDIIEVSSPDRKSHFVGSIVFIHDGVVLSSEMSKLTIIDGQQRITTMTLLWLAILERAKEFQIKKLEKTILKNYIINEDYEGEEKLKLKPTANNNFILKGIINQGVNFDYNEPSNLLVNFEFFYNNINKNNIENVIEGISKLLFIEVSLERDKDDPQRIFESLNSTGLDLTQSDLIRNFILIDVEPSLQNKLYTNFWRPIEKYANLHETNKDKIDDFMRDYLTMQNKKIPNKNKVYETFREKYQFQHNKENLENLLTELRQYAKHYNKLINPQKETDKDIRHNIELINTLEVTVSYPFFLQIYQDYDKNIISKDQFIAVFKIIQSFIFRRFIVDLGTASLNKIFIYLYSEIDKNDYINSLQLKLVQRQRSQRFPNNTEIKDKLKFKDLYNIKSQKRRYLFLQLENALHKENITWDDYSIEHIFPQESRKWRTELPENELLEIQNTYLHTISNLTLTKYNSQFSNKIFSEKRDMPKGFKESHIFLNEYIATFEKWNLESLNKRYEILYNQFCKIWSYPDIEIPIDDKSKEINIFDIHDATNLKIEYFLIEDEKIKIKFTNELLFNVVKMFFKDELKSFVGTELGKKLRITKNPTDKKGFSLIGEDYYLYVRLSSNDVFKKTKLVLEAFNWTDELFIKFKEKKED